MSEFDRLLEEVEAGRFRYKHIHFEPTEDEKWMCKNNKSGDVLAMVEYYKPWKKHVVYMKETSIFDEGCLEDIADFLKQLNGK